MRVKFLAQGNNSNTGVATPGIKCGTFRLPGCSWCPNHFAILPHFFFHIHTHTQTLTHTHTHIFIHTHSNIPRTFHMPAYNWICWQRRRQRPTGIFWHWDKSFAPLCAFSYKEYSSGLQVPPEGTPVQPWSPPH